MFSVSQHTILHWFIVSKLLSGYKFLVKVYSSLFCCVIDVSYRINMYLMNFVVNFRRPPPQSSGDEGEKSERNDERREDGGDKPPRRSRYPRYRRRKPQGENDGKKSEVSEKTPEDVAPEQEQPQEVQA